MRLIDADALIAELEVMPIDIGFEDIDRALEVVKEQPEAVIRCKDCKYFVLDYFQNVKGFPIPLIVAHEICTKWSDGCKTSPDGWCFMGERRTDEKVER